MLYIFVSISNLCLFGLCSTSRQCARKSTAKHASSLIRATVHGIFLRYLSRQPRSLSSWNNYRFAPSRCLTTSLCLMFLWLPEHPDSNNRARVNEKKLFLGKDKRHLLIAKMTSKLISKSSAL